MPANTWFLLRVFLVVGFLSLFLLLELLIESTDFDLLVPHSLTDHPDGAPQSRDGFLVYTKGCRIPDLDPMDPSIQKFIYDEPRLDCEEQYGPALVASDLTSLYVNMSALSHFNISDTSQLSCCYQPFWRVEMAESSSGVYPSNVDTRVRYGKQCIEFVNRTTVRGEFVKIICRLNNESIYLDYHAFTPIKRNVREQAKLGKEEAISVLILGVDAVSRLNFYRQMPQTVEFLKENLSAVEMLGYNKVEDNTYPNLVPVLTGLSDKELSNVCWAKTSSVFDSCPFVWDNFRTAGYKTAFGEDASWMGIFSYLKRGFRKQPTDYYMNTFSKESEGTIGFEKRLNAKLCVGPRKTIQTLLNYVYKFAITMKDTLSFGFFWGASLTHDYLNMPKYGDEEHRHLLESLHSENILNRTVLIVMSDHGIRWGGIRSTYQGYLEERLPFLFIVYPNWFKVKYTTAVANLRKNAEKLTTPYDLHEVLLDLTNMMQLDKDILRARAKRLEKAEPFPRGISLFLPIPDERTCSSAGIDDHWCTCHISKVIPTNSSQVRHAAQHLVKHINSLLLKQPQCAKLQLYKIRSAREESSTSHKSFRTTDAGIQDFSITIETSPGGALFEATVRYNGNKNNFTTVGTISRINLYGSQSKCVSQYRLRLYCYCI